MRLALLQCDHVADAFLPITGGDYDQVFKRFFADHDSKVTLDVFDVTLEHYPDDPYTYDAFVTTGSKFSVYDDEPWVKTLKAYVVDLYQRKQKLIGICFGHQMIAEALGGKVAKAVGGWGIGVHRFAVTEQLAWMQPQLSHIQVLMSCQDQVQVLPKDSKVLASSDFCPVAMYQVAGHFLGIQGHPEFSAAYAEALMQARVSRIGEATVAKARSSLSIPLHQKELTQWILNFIRFKG